MAHINLGQYLIFNLCQIRYLVKGKRSKRIPRLQCKKSNLDKSDLLSSLLHLEVLKKKKSRISRILQKVRPGTRIKFKVK